MRDMSLLTQLLDILFPPRESELYIRTATEYELLTLYHPRTFMLSRAYVTALLPYQDPRVRACIAEAKFRNNKKAQIMLGHVLAKHFDHLTKLVKPLNYSPALVPVPLGQNRRKERGYNQVEEIWKKARKQSTNPPLFSNLLIRIRETTPQTSLDGSDRRKNLIDAFDLTSTPDPAYLYIVLDDVLTTGATLSAAGRAIAGMGIRPISLLALAH